MAFQPGFTDGRTLAEPLGKIVCVGRNYAAHARELNNEVPTAPLLFIKPASSATPMKERIRVPRHLGEVHFETEVALLIGHRLCRARPEEVLPAIVGVGLALDLTLRDVQSRLKDKGHPWERAKGFDGACPISEFVPYDAQGMNLDDLRFSLTIDGERRQTGHTALMLFKAVELIVEISRSFTLEPGDVILTGTPEGVGALPEGARLALSLDGHFEITARS
ncbi:fumarylacetoacetate hydrolase family protein [Kushneria sp. Sum13]|uniref:fumarylacetoacetate hydrolase family protein n=1 Tax=Kushneria sp. Sum13 TaxID=3459196 RepID=UPI0040452E24